MPSQFNCSTRRSASTVQLLGRSTSTAVSARPAAHLTPSKLAPHKAQGSFLATWWIASRGNSAPASSSSRNILRVAGAACAAQSTCSRQCTSSGAFLTPLATTDPLGIPVRRPRKAQIINHGFSAHFEHLTSHRLLDSRRGRPAYTVHIGKTTKRFPAGSLG